MAFLVLDVEKLRYNYTLLDNLFRQKHIEWAVVTKLLCGNIEYLRELLSLGVRQVCDSRVLNLRTIKEIAPNVETIFIKPAGKRIIRSVVAYADISCNTDAETIRMLSKEAVRQGKTHKIVLMVELGELREGIMRAHLLPFYEQANQCENIEIVGIGTQLSCLNGILPNHEKLTQLCLFKQLIESTYGTKIDYVSGGSSVTIPLLFNGQMPECINHLRVGETLFFGTDVYNSTPYNGMMTDVLSLYAEIIELTEKPTVPTGEIGHNLEGQKPDFRAADSASTSLRAILDVGLLDIDIRHIYPKDKQLEIVGVTSDMLVIDLKDNPNNYRVHDRLEFGLDYMGALRVLNSKYIEKKIRH